MGAIRWEYLGEGQGQKLEDFAAACLRRRYDAHQLRPSQGDGGVDVFKKRNDGLEVWQIKSFIAPPNSGQKRQIKESWRRFQEKHGESGRDISKYHLVTPWTPTQEAYAWFDEEITRGAGFPCQWDGESWFEDLAAAYPDLLQHYFGGQDHFDKHVLAKSILASSPVEHTGGTTLLDNIRRRDVALRELSGYVDSEYNVQWRTETTRDGSLPIPSSNDAAIAYRYEALGNNEFRTEALVPKTAQSMELEPITLEVSMRRPAPGSREEEALRDWEHWGTPFEDLPALTRVVGGPWEEPDPKRGALTVKSSAENTREFPDIDLEVINPNDVVVRSLALKVTEVTHGQIGNGQRLVACSRGGLLQVDLRTGSSVVNEVFDLRIAVRPGTKPAAILREVETVNAMSEPNTLRLAIENGGPLALAVANERVDVPPLIEQVAKDLAHLQQHTTQQLRMPDLGKVNDVQITHLHRVANVYRGIPWESTWKHMELTRTDGPALEPDQWAAGRALLKIQQPVVELGDDFWVVTRPVAESYESVVPARGIPSEGLNLGDTLELVPQASDRVVVSMFEGAELDGGKLLNGSETGEDRE